MADEEEMRRTTRCGEVIDQALGTLMREQALCPTSEGRAMPTNWFLVGEGVDSDGDEVWYLLHAPATKLRQTLGLLAWAQVLTNLGCVEYLNGLGEE